MSTLEELCKEVLARRDRKGEIEAALKDATAALEGAEGELLSTMANMGLTAFKLDGLSFTAGVRVFASIASAEEALPWLREHGLGGLVKETVHAGTLSAAVKDLASQGEPIPPSIRVYEKPILSIRGR